MVICHPGWWVVPERRARGVAGSHDGGGRKGIVALSSGLSRACKGPELIIPQVPVWVIRPVPVPGPAAGTPDAAPAFPCNVRGRTPWLMEDAPG